MDEKDYSGVEKAFKKIRSNENNKLLKDIVDVIRCRIPNKNTDENEDLIDIKYITVADISSYRCINNFKSCKVNHKTLTKVQDGLIENDIIISTIGRVGSVKIIPEIDSDDNIYCHQSLIVLRVKDGDLNPKAIYMYFKSDLVQSFFRQSAFKHPLPRIFKQNILELPFPLNLHNQFIKNFDRVRTLSEQIDEADKEIRELYLIKMF